jgi:hypothetical protein
LIQNLTLYSLDPEILISTDGDEFGMTNKNVKSHTPPSVPPLEGEGEDENFIS